MKTHDLFKVVGAVVFIGLVLLLINPVLRSTPALASPSPGLESVTVLCSSCSFSGLPQEGHIILMDTKTGEIWAYSDGAMTGKEKPVYLGTLAALGQPVVKLKK
jgi:hypothetical protein